MPGQPLGAGDVFGGQEIENHHLARRFETLPQGEVKLLALKRVERAAEDDGQRARVRLAVLESSI